MSISTVSGSAGATTLTTPQIPSHTHSLGAFIQGNQPSQFTISRQTSFYNPLTLQPTGSTGGDGSHTHPFSFSSGSGTFTGNAINLAVQYIDVIRATAN